MTSHDNHGEGVSHQAQRHCRTSCSHLSVDACSGEAEFRKWTFLVGITCLWGSFLDGSAALILGTSACLGFFFLPWDLHRMLTFDWQPLQPFDLRCKVKILRLTVWPVWLSLFSFSLSSVFQPPTPHHHLPVCHSLPLSVCLLHCFGWFCYCIPVVTFCRHWW